jgi:hypothetical protein
MSDATATELELIRRLDAAGATASVDEQAWAKIEGRIAARRRRRRRPRPRQLLALAAAAVVVLAAILVVRDDGSRVETHDPTTTTTDRDRRATTTTADDERPETTTTSIDDRGNRPAQSTRPGGGPAPSGTGAGGAAPSSPSPGAPGATGGGSSTDPGSPAGGGSSPTTIPTPHTTLPDGHAPAVSFAASGYTLQATFHFSSGLFQVSIWRPDRGFLTDWVRDDQPGQNCLAGESEFEFDFPEPGTHAYSWGMVRADAAEVRVVATSGESTTAIIGAETVPGLRAWIAKSPPGQVDRFEARDAAGGILHIAPRAGGFDASPDRC